MVPRGGEGVGQVSEESFAIVTNFTGLAMHQTVGAANLSAENLSNALMSQANAQNGNPAVKMPDVVATEPGVVRRAGPRRNDQKAGAEFLLGLSRGEPVVAEYGDLLSATQLADSLHEVVSETVVIVQDKDHKCQSTPNT